MNDKKLQKIVSECIIEAERKKISPFKCIKDKFIYKKVSGKEKLEGKCCGRCSQFTQVKFGIKRNQCLLIGITESKSADVISDYICKYFHKR